MIKKKNNNGETAFVIACLNNREEMAMLLIEEADVPNEAGETGFMTAAKCGLSKVISVIISVPTVKAACIGK